MSTRIAWYHNKCVHILGKQPHRSDESSRARIRMYTYMNAYQDACSLTHTSLQGTKTCMHDKHAYMRTHADSLYIFLCVCACVFRLCARACMSALMSNTWALDQMIFQSKFELALGLVKCMEDFLEGKEPENLQLN